MKVHSKVIDRIVNEATKSNHRTFKIGAAILNKHKIVSLGYNKIIKINNLIPNEKMQWWKKDGICSIHAEADALIKADGEKLNKATIVVIRVNKNKKFGNAFPCKQCFGLIMQAGIKRIIYSINHYPYLKVYKVR